MRTPTFAMRATLLTGVGELWSFESAGAVAPGVSAGASIDATGVSAGAVAPGVSAGARIEMDKGSKSGKGSISCTPVFSVSRSSCTWLFEI